MNPFILYEMDFDSEMFRKFYGSIDSPGIYAIPEDEVEPKNTEDENESNPFTQSSDDETPEVDQNLDDKEKIDAHLLSTPGLQPLQLDQNQQMTYDSEVTPIKKMFLLNKLYQLSHLLKNKFSTNEELELILKFGANLSYPTLQVLAINVINNLRELAQQERQEGSETNNEVQATV